MTGNNTMVKENVIEPITTIDNETKGNEVNIQSVKHPLENKWGFWFYSNVSKIWDQNQIKLTNFDTVEDYWCLYHHMKLPSELEHGQDYSVFKHGIQPMWEDPANKKGGRWLVTLDKRNNYEMNALWSDTVLMLIGENFEECNQYIRGAVVSVRPRNKKNKIGVWLSDKTKEAAVIEIGRKLKEVVGIPWTLSFYGHNSNTTLYTV